MRSRSWRSRSTCSWIGCSLIRSRIRGSAVVVAADVRAAVAVLRAAAVAAAGKAVPRVRRAGNDRAVDPRLAAGMNNTPGVRMSRSMLAALAGVSLCGAVQAQTYEAVADWLKVPAGRETLGPMHGDIAVSRAGDVYVSVET